MLEKKEERDVILVYTEIMHQYHFFEAIINYNFSVLKISAFIQHYIRCLACVCAKCEQSVHIQDHLLHLPRIKNIYNIFLSNHQVIFHTQDSCRKADLIHELMVQQFFSSLQSTMLVVLGCPLIAYS